jgi:hypothetical protein
VAVQRRKRQVILGPVVRERVIRRKDSEQGTAYGVFAQDAERSQGDVRLPASNGRDTSRDRDRQQDPSKGYDSGRRDGCAVQYQVGLNLAKGDFPAK